MLGRVVVVPFFVGFDATAAVCGTGRLVLCLRRRTSDARKSAGSATRRAVTVVGFAFCCPDAPASSTVTFITATSARELARSRTSSRATA